MGNNNGEYDTETGEILDDAGDIGSTSLAIGLSRAEIDTQIATARAFPRGLIAVQKQLLEFVTLDEDTAIECMYALKRGKKAITGPSIRFAEALQASYGNCRSASRIVFVDRAEKVVIAEGAFHDLQTNSAKRAEVRRGIVTKEGRIYGADMITVTGNAAAQIALRNAILSGVPRLFWRNAFATVQRIITGDVTTLATKRAKAIEAFAVWGVKPEDIFRVLEVAGEQEIGLDDIPILRGMFAAIKNQEATVEETFYRLGGEAAADGKPAPVRNPLQDGQGPGQTMQGAGEPQSATQPAKRGPGRPKKVTGEGAPPAGADTQQKPAETQQAGATTQPATEPAKTIAVDPAATAGTIASADPPSGSQQGAAAAVGPSPGGEAAAKSDGPSPNPPATKELLREYSKALYRVESKKGLAQIDEQFFEQRKRPVDPESLKKLGLIYDAHLQRVDGKLDIMRVDMIVADTMG